MTAIGGEVPTNGAQSAIETELPYIAQFTIQGVSDLLFHAWNCEAIEERSNAAKGSKAKKTDNIETFVFRNDLGELCLPGRYLCAAIIKAAKFRQDPRSPRKSAEDLFKAGICPITNLASLGVKVWDYEHKQRKVIQRSAVTGTWPALKSGWRATIQIQCNLPEYISPAMLNETAQRAGKLMGVGDLRPTYGRFQVVEFKLIDLD